MIHEQKQGFKLRIPQKQVRAIPGEYGTMTIEATAVSSFTHEGNDWAPARVVFEQRALFGCWLNQAHPVQSLGASQQSDASYELKGKTPYKGILQGLSGVSTTGLLDYIYGVTTIAPIS